MNNRHLVAAFGFAMSLTACSGSGGQSGPDSGTVSVTSEEARDFSATFAAAENYTPSFASGGDDVQDVPANDVVSAFCDNGGAIASAVNGSKAGVIFKATWKVLIRPKTGRGNMSIA